MSDNILNVSRRGFLQGMVSTGALVLSVRMVPDVLWAAETAAGTATATHADRAVLHPSAFVGIDTDGTVYIIAHRSEMGTTSRTSLPLVAAEELDADAVGMMARDTPGAHRPQVDALDLHRAARRREPGRGPDWSARPVW